MRQGRLEAFLGRARPDKAGGGSGGARGAASGDDAAMRKRSRAEGEDGAVDGGSKENAAPAAAGKQQGLPSGSGGSKRAAAAGAAVPAPTTAPAQAQAAAPPGSKPAAPPGAGGGKMLAKRSQQMFLDLGQRDFNASRCPACGMVYARGQEEDEKLHRAYCSGGGGSGGGSGSGGVGVKFPGWAAERVLLTEPFQGRLLLVTPSDPASHIKKVQEVAALVERLHSLTPGWLLAGEAWRAFLYVSTARRIVGLLVAEPLRQAFRVVAPGDASGGGGGGGGQEADSMPRGGGASGSGSGAAAQQAAGRAAAPMPAAAAAPSDKKGIWRGLHGRAASHAAQGLSGGAGSSLGSSGAGPGGHGADSCPSALISDAVAAGLGPTGETAAAAAAGTMSPPPPRAAAAAGGGGGVPAAAAAAAAAAAGGRTLAIDRSRPMRAAVGVRMVWVAPEARRKGIASRLLDAARANMVQCYVAPRAQLAFTQPTEAGAALAAAYVGSQQWLIYGV